MADTGNVAGFTAGVKMEIQQVPGMKNKLLGGEGLFNTLLTGPGRVWLQTMPISSVAASIRPYIPTGNGEAVRQPAGCFFQIVQRQRIALKDTCGKSAWDRKLRHVRPGGL